MQRGNYNSFRLFDQLFIYFMNYRIVSSIKEANINISNQYLPRRVLSNIPGDHIQYFNHMYGPPHHILLFRVEISRSFRLMLPKNQNLPKSCWTTSQEILFSTCMAYAEHTLLLSLIRKLRKRYDFSSSKWLTYLINVFHLKPPYIYFKHFAWWATPCRQLLNNLACDYCLSLWFWCLQFWTTLVKSRTHAFKGLGKITWNILKCISDVKL